MKNAADFIRFALSHAKPDTIPQGAELPMSIGECGSEPWEYLYGTTGHTATRELLERKYESFYGPKGWTRASYDIATENWAEKRVHVTDCQGLLDCFLGTDVNANYCYTAWCTQRGRISDITRAYKLAEAVFCCGSEGRMTHVGWVCGFLDGEPLVVEARGIRFGVCVTRLSERPWTHRGLVTKKLSYDYESSDEPVTLKLTSPMIQGKAVKDLQTALNALGYYCGSADGKCGKLTMNGIISFVRAHKSLCA